MNRESLAKLALVALVCIPLVALKVRMLQTLPNTGGQALAAIETFARAAGFGVDEVVATTSGVQVHLRSGACQVLVKEVAPQGWDVSTMTVLASGRKLAYLFKGRLYDEQPTWRTWFDFRVWRALRLLGIETRRHVVYGIASSPNCDARATDWNGLSSIR